MGGEGEGRWGGGGDALSLSLSLSRCIRSNDGLYRICKSRIRYIYGYFYRIGEGLWYYLEESFGRGPAGVHDALGDTFPVELGEFLDEVVVFEKNSASIRSEEYTSVKKGDICVVYVTEKG